MKFKFNNNNNKFIIINPPKKLHLFQNIVNYFYIKKWEKRNFGRLIIQSCMNVWKYNCKYEMLLWNEPYLTPGRRK